MPTDVWEDIPLPAAHADAWEDVPLPAGTPAVGAGETFVNSGANALPLGKQVVDSLSALLLHANRPESSFHLTPQALEEAKKLGIKLPEEPKEPSLVEDYRNLRDTRAARTAAGEEQNPVAALGGKALGTTASILAPLPGIEAGGALVPETVAGSKLAAKALAGGLTGAGYGALSGAAGSSADLTKGEVKQALKDAAKGAEYGAAAGTVAPVVFEGGAKALRGMGIGAGRRALAGGSEMGAVRKALPEEAVEAAVNEGAIKPGGTVQGAVKRLHSLTKAGGEQHGKIIEGLEQAGVTGPEPTALGVKMLDEAAANRAGKEGAVNPALQSALEREAKRLDNLEKVPSGELKLSVAENAKKGLQDAAKAEYSKVPGRVSQRGDANMAVAARLRNANQAAVESQAAKSPELAQAFPKSAERLRNLYAAEEAAEKGAALKQGRSWTSALKEVIPAALLSAGAGMHGGASEGALTFVPALVAGHLANSRGPSTAAYAGIKGAQMLRQAATRGGAGALAGKEASEYSNAEDPLRILGKRPSPKKEP